MMSTPPMSQRYTTQSAEETVALGVELARRYPPPVTMLLIGDLGAGKTTLAHGLSEGYGVDPDEVASPTFPLIHEYGDPVRVYHIDLYRLDTIAEVEGLGLDDIFASPAAVLMEWAERFPTLLPRRRIEVRITTLAEDRREVAVTEVRA
jgi:tRNA threonylcarbamoyladenosine biosynthesis protein TsaE